MKTIFSKGEPLYEIKEMLKGKNTYKAVSIEPNQIYAKQSAKDWRDSGYKSFYIRKKGYWVVYVK